jgi:hypothetical protein
VITQVVGELFGFHSLRCIADLNNCELLLRHSQQGSLQYNQKKTRMNMPTKVLTVDVEIVDCRSHIPIKEFQIPDTGDADVNRQIAELIHTTMFGKPYECTRCSGGDYHFNQSVQFVGPVTHNGTSKSSGNSTHGSKAGVETRRYGGLDIPVDHNGIPYVASYDCS